MGITLGPQKSKYFKNYFGLITVLNKIQKEIMFKKEEDEEKS